MDSITQFLVPREKVQSSGHFRPNYHFSAPKGWINDPNGFFFLDGWFHIFYQFNREHTEWASPSIGHSRTRDFIRFEELAEALTGLEVVAKGDYLNHTGKFLSIRTLFAEGLISGDNEKFAKEALFLTYMGAVIRTGLPHSIQCSGIFPIPISLLSLFFRWAAVSFLSLMPSFRSGLTALEESRKKRRLSCSGKPFQ